MQTYARITAQNIDMPMPPCKIDVKLNEGDEIKVGKLKLKVWHTPGHTPGQLSFKLGNLLFSGDNIYKDGCVGVIDAHHGSNLPSFISSLNRIRDDDAEFLLPSHGPVFRKDPAILQNADRPADEVPAHGRLRHLHGLLAARGRVEAGHPWREDAGVLSRGVNIPGAPMIRRAIKIVLFASALGCGRCSRSPSTARPWTAPAPRPPRSATSAT